MFFHLQIFQVFFNCSLDPNLLLPIFNGNDIIDESSERNERGTRHEILVFWGFA